MSALTRSRPVVVAAAVGTAVVVNLVVYGLGRAAGGSFTFTRAGVPTAVDAATVAGFSAVPLLLGLVVVALLGRRWPVVARMAVVVAPVLAVVTVGLMTLPVDLDTVSTVTLALCHLTLAPISVLAIRALRGHAG
ncbi:hypothetical protein G7075_08905 [Phycicoccus sp. HDW14]|uniref:DUF6069 family protein n=1 Tax=Phycicoccus sp. HDW14 TaxID=2714941 RepID=UPI00140B9FC7|nr:DUF6069 family protein [Phycicoccus sp. HDW14]QIM21222.1 hypothetical protein G7075_08905 [Phycicoccus sp. HDW14]